MLPRQQAGPKGRSAIDRSRLLEALSLTSAELSPSFSSLCCCLIADGQFQGSFGKSSLSDSVIEQLSNARGQFLSTSGCSGLLLIENDSESFIDLKTLLQLSNSPAQVTQQARLLSDAKTCSKGTS